MKGFLRRRAHRYGYDGWAARIKGAPRPIEWTTCTTREELRQLLRERRDLFAAGVELVKVRIVIEVAGQ